MIRLHYTKSGQGCPLIILHGLYGSGSNWHNFARALSAHFTVYLVDQRNHGASPHSPEFNYELMAQDLKDFMDSLNIEQACLMGHSMGGKVVMNFTVQYPERVRKLIVIDIALRSYLPEETNLPGQQFALHRKIINSLARLDLDFIETREEADRQLARELPQRSIRQFLLKNLKRDKNGQFYWGLNLTALHDNLPNLLKEVDTGGKSFENSVLVISGIHSGYIIEEDKADFQRTFPRVKIEELDAGHWVHAEQPGKLQKLLISFLPEN